MAKSLALNWPPEAELLATHFWPGPLTIIVPKRPAIPDVVTAGLPSVALRMPSHPVALAVIEAAGVPLAAPSANRFTQLSPPQRNMFAMASVPRWILCWKADPAPSASRVP